MFIIFNRKELEVCMVICENVFYIVLNESKIE